MCVVFIFVVLLPEPFQSCSWNGDEVSSGVFVYMCYFILCVYSVLISGNVFFWVALCHCYLDVW